MNTGERIRALRKEKGLTQEQLADLTGVSLMSIRRYEKGNKKYQADILEKIAEALDVDVNFLLTGEIRPIAAELRKVMEDAKKIAESVPLSVRETLKKHGLTITKYTMLKHDYDDLLDKHNIAHPELMFLFTDIQTTMIEELDMKENKQD